jgi:aspartokinase
MKWLILSNILHAKTIIPLLENIPLRILNTFNHENKGTLITSNSNASGIKTLSVLENVFVNLEGRGLLGKTGVDRIFSDGIMILVLVLFLKVHQKEELTCGCC